MVIDVHVHPTGYSLISQDPEERKFRDKVFQRKYDESKLPIAMTGKPSGGNSGGGNSEEVTFTQMDSFGIDRLVPVSYTHLDVYKRQAWIGAKGKKVLLADIDPQGNATSGFGINKRSLMRSSYDLLIGTDVYKRQSQSCFVKFFSGLAAVRFDFRNAQRDWSIIGGIVDKQRVQAFAQAAFSDCHKYFPPFCGLTAVFG